MLKISFSLLLLLQFQSCSHMPLMVQVDPELERQRLLNQLDTDRDNKLTVLDQGGVFDLRSKQGKSIRIEETYHQSNLLQELTLLKLRDGTSLSTAYIFEDPVERLERNIRERFWDGLTRRIDKEHLGQVLVDTKVNSSHYYLYVPFNDKLAWNYYKKLEFDRPELNFKVVRLPSKITPNYVKSLNGKHGLLSLALTRDPNDAVTGVPYVVPGGRFNEMYGWDSYFEALGLINDGRSELARAMIDNFVYQINHYGKILNANRTYYLTRSQPPFLTSMIRATYETMPKTEENEKWLRNVAQSALREYENVWMGQERLTSTGLSRYAGFGLGIPPEVEPGHYNAIIGPHADVAGIKLSEYIKRYDLGLIKNAKLDEFFLHDRAVRESGHDTTYRWRVGSEDKCADFVTVDLNSLLYKTEMDLAVLIPARSQEFKAKAQARKKIMMTLLWNPEKKIFYDYNWKLKKQSEYLSATSFYPLWAGLVDQEIAQSLVSSVLPELEVAGGVAASSQNSLKKSGDPEHERQWDYPNGWAPHQMLIWQGLLNYQMSKTAHRLIYKWLYMITKNARDYNGTIPEKYDVVNSSHKVFAEYGNVGTEFDYITTEGFGWMNASYQVGLKLLPAKDLSKLKKALRRGP